MNENVTKADVSAAMQARIDDGTTFQAKQLTEIGEKMTGARYVKDGGAFLPVSRVADRLLQANRKVGAISFKNGWWTRNAKFPAPKPSQRKA